MEVMTMRTD